MEIKIQEALSLDDLLIIPRLSSLDTRKEVDLSTSICGYKLKIPIISAPMSTVTEYEMAKSFAELGSFGVIHRYLTHEQQIEEIKKMRKAGHEIIAVAISTNDKERVKKVVEAGANILCIEVAHGYTKKCLDMISHIKKNYPRIKIMGGNIATNEAARALVKAGVDILRVGFGSGAVCTTRIKTGVGVPNATALSWVTRSFKNKVSIILDGGIKNSGDIVKALALGADAVMVGSLIAGTQETPGRLIKEGNMAYKRYSGMASINEQIKYKGESSDDLYEEGIEIRVPFRGPVKDIIRDVTQTMRAGFAYIGARNINEVRTKSKFIKITHAGLIESRAHAINK